MKKISATLFAVACFGSTAFAGAIAQPGDFYLISRDRFGFFVGSHKLFVDPYKGLKQVSYCNRDYFVRSHSVAWTEVETRRGNVVRIEYNFGRGWRPICEGPEDQVTLTDLGISMSADDVLQTEEASSTGQSRLSSIGSMFQTGEPANTDSSYHTR
ncbi:hypothetical protein [Roseibium marinum]|uniref:Uncharacterized protein n=1 Tax=Roseibium marinum TaxID=281252 RepID=A0A2S3UQT4_9HYPH|nr:hypothetical protein [Roseibium marinum]POF30072.1 hypothetical protein CLV41_10798 [Roseibium marinum]